MVENQHRKIAGYRDLTEREIELMNECKALAIVVGTMCDKLEEAAGIDDRWLSIARTDLQRGFMELIRSIAKPETF